MSTHNISFLEEIEKNTNPEMLKKKSALCEAQTV